MYLLQIIKNKYLMRMIFSICMSFYSISQINQNKNIFLHTSIIFSIIVYWKYVSYKTNK